MLVLTGGSAMCGPAALGRVTTRPPRRAAVSHGPAPQINIDETLAAFLNPADDARAAALATARRATKARVVSDAAVRAPPEAHRLAVAGEKSGT